VVVVSGGHVVESSLVLHLLKTSVKVWSWGSIEEHAVSDVLFSFSVVTTVGSQELSVVEATSLVQISHALSDVLVREELGVGVQPLVGGWVVLVGIGSLDNVRSIGLVSSFSGISSRVGVTTGPVEVNVVVDFDIQVRWSEVVFSGWVSLDNVSSLSSDVQVEDSGILWYILWSVLDVEDGRSVLEGSSVLSGINSQKEVESFDLDDVVLVNRGLGSVFVPVNEFLVWSVSVSSEISSGNVVSDSEDTIAVVSRNATFFRRRWQSPVKEVVVDSISVSKMVFS
jgi:hypothetical protein